MFGWIVIIRQTKIVCNVCTGMFIFMQSRNHSISKVKNFG